MKISVVIVNWNTCAFLRDCLAALERFAPANAELETIVVDNASADGSTDLVRSQFPGVTLIANAENAGYAAGNNQAFQAASGDILLLLNPDVVVRKDSLTRTVQWMIENPKTGGLGARLVGADGKTQGSLRGFPDPLPVLWEYLGIARLFPRNRRLAAYRMSYFDYERPGEADQPMGSFLAIRRAALDAVGPMDEDFPIFFNEVDWCYRAKRYCGWSIDYTPDVVVTHHGAASTRQVKARMIRESHRSLIRFYEKHYRTRMSLMLYRIIITAVILHERRAIRRANRAAS